MLQKELICGFTDIGLAENICKYPAVSRDTRMPSEAEVDDPIYDEKTGEFDDSGLEFGFLRCRALERALENKNDPRDENLKVCEQQKKCSLFLTYAQYQTFLRKLD